MTILQIRGTSGSGKTTLVRQVLNLAPAKDTMYLKGRKNPYFYRLKFRDHIITVPCSYVSECGGADTVKTYDELYAIIKQEHAAGHDVLFEGLLCAHDGKRSRDLWEHLGRDPKLFQILELTDPLEVCLASVEKRRAGRKNPPKTAFNPDNTIRRYKEVQRSCEQLEALGIPIHRHRRDEAVTVALQLLKLPVMVTEEASFLLL